MKTATTTLFAQLMNLTPRDALENIASEFYTPGNATKFSIWDQYVALVFCHIAGAESLREIEDGLYSALGGLQHAGGAKAMKRTTLAYANSKRDYHIFEVLSVPRGPLLQIVSAEAREEVQEADLRH